MAMESSRCEMLPALPCRNRITPRACCPRMYHPFVVMLPEGDSPERVEQVAARLLDAVSAGILVEGQEIFVNCSVGAAFYPDDGANAEILMANPDNAMYQAKSARTGSLYFFKPEMNLAAKERLSLVQALHGAEERERSSSCSSPS